MVSRAPVCSPTLIICTTMDGKTPVSSRGPAMVLPSSMLLRVAMMASSMIAFPEVRAVISRPSRIGTPDWIRVPRVRQKRATEILRIRSPSTGSFRVNWSICRRPL